MKVLFLDRDGVINKEVNYLHKIEDFVYTYRCKDAMRRFQQNGFEIVVITNQAGIAKGIFDEDAYRALTNFYYQDLLSSNIKILDILYCPHHGNGTIAEFTRECDCRKPAPGLIYQAASAHAIDLESSVLVGDKISDMHAGMNAGIKNCFLVESGHSLPQYAYEEFPIFKDLYDLSKTLFGTVNL